MVSSSESDVMNLNIMYDYYKADYNLIRNDLSQLDWSRIIETNDIEITWNRIKSELITVRDKYIKTKQCKKTNKNSWVTRKVTRCRQTKEKV